MISTKEEIFRLPSGRAVAKLIIRKANSGERKYIQLENVLLNKSELIQLLGWLITKSDEMNEQGCL